MRKVVLSDEQLCGMAHVEMIAKYPNDTKEMLAQKARDALPYMRREMLKVNCVLKMRECTTFDDDYIFQTAEEMVDDMPDALIPNLEEWLDDKPISELRIGNLSLKEIMDYTKRSFLSCMPLMIKYVNSGCRYAESSILNYFAGKYS